MKFLTTILVIMLGATLISSCSKSQPTDEEIEQAGHQWLLRARASLADADYDLARIYIDSLRERCPMALNAREDGILLLDSIELAQAVEQLQQAEFFARQSDLDYIARDSADTNLDRAMAKVKFFQKKIGHDLANKKQH